MVDHSTISAPVRSELAKFEAGFEQLLHSDVPLAEDVVRYISGLKGKRLRPMLVHLCALVHGKSNERTMQASYVVELLHTATLVHDDVVDASDIRRGVPTVNQLWNNKVSVLVGDFLFSKTLTSLLDLNDQQALAIFSETAKQITEGELLQIAKAKSFDLDYNSYIDLISKKTASLFRASCELGALSVTPDADARKQMNLFGYHLGLAFQIKDDLLDYVGDENTLGKPTGNDIRENKVTLPLIYAIAQAPEKEKQEIISLFDEDIVKDGKVERVVSFVHAYQGVRHAEEIAASFADKAKQLLHQYPKSDARTSLESLVEFAINREK